MNDSTYELIDSGDQKKLERFGPYILIRPCSQAIWKPKCPQSQWEKADAIFDREKGNRWKGKLPSFWTITYANLQFKLIPTDFGHIGLFPEHADQWSWMQKKINGKKANILNLFAYSGGATLACVKEGASVCHLDASKASVQWAKENAALNQMEKAPIRWIVDDAIKFLIREVKRGSKYDGIILDPPSFGRGSQGQVFKIEKDVQKLLDLVSNVLTPKPLFVIFTSHTPGFTPMVLHHLLDQFFTKGKIESGEMLIPSSTSNSLPSGNYARWGAHD